MRQHIDHENKGVDVTGLMRICDPTWAEVAALTYGKSIHDMQDIGQIAGIKYWLQQRRGTIRQHSAYLRQVIRRTIIDQARSAVRQPMSREIADDGRPFARGVRRDPSDSCHLLAERLDLHTMIEWLPPKQQDVVRRRLAGDSICEIAEEDGVPLGRIRQRWTRAKRALQQLSNLHDDENP